MGLPEGRDIYIDHEENDKPYVMKNSHIHDYYEIYYLMAGTRRYFINHTLYNMEPGDVILVNKGDLHLTTMISSEHYYERYLMTFNDNFVERVSQNIDRELFMNAFEVKKVHVPVSKRYAFEALYINSVQNASATMNMQIFSHIRIWLNL